MPKKYLLAIRDLGVAEFKTKEERNSFVNIIKKCSPKVEYATTETETDIEPSETIKAIAKQAFNAIEPLLTLLASDREESMDGDETEAISKEFLKLIDEVEGNK